MAIATQKRKGESNEKLISRWKRKTTAAQVVKSFREKMYFKKSDNETKERNKAIIREGFRAQKKKAQFYS